jgi:DNA-binding PadR family transcriptional regulator
MYEMSARLERRNLIGSAWAEKGPNGHRRRRYWITAIGQRALQEASP